jgi:hypothetical protein
VVGALRQTATRRGLSADAREPVEKCAEYLHKNAWHLRYPEFLRLGFPIATGVIEGACRHLVQDRLGITVAEHVKAQKFEQPGRPRSRRAG